MPYDILFLVQHVNPAPGENLTVENRKNRQSIEAQVISTVLQSNQFTRKSNPLDNWEL